MKARRQSAILDAIQRQRVRSQEELRRRLRTAGYDVTQATLSRDIRELGLVKRAVDGAYRRSAAESPGAGGEAALRRAVEEYLRTQETIEQLLVLRTDPGQAQSLAIAIDRSRLPEIAGTIGGDDTILVICRSATDATAIAERFRSMR